jgi:hypothetical protein
MTKHNLSEAIQEEELLDMCEQISTNKKKSYIIR